MTEINIKGDVISNDVAAFYEFWDLPYVSPENIENKIKDSEDDLTIYVASNGGEVFAASEIYTMLKSYKGKVTAKIQGLAASAASVIAMAADTIEISPTAQIMIHKAQTTSEGNADAFKHEASVLDTIDESIMNAYQARTHLDQGEILNLMAKETWLTAQQAVDYGFADAIMFTDDNKTQYTNSTEKIISPKALNKFKNMQLMVNKYKELTQNKETENKESQLFKNKLAILLQKTGGA